MPVLEAEDSVELDSALVHGVCTIYDDRTVGLDERPQDADAAIRSDVWFTRGGKR